MAGGMDPWMTSLLSIFAASNPEVAGPMLDQAGVPTPANRAVWDILALHAGGRPSTGLGAGAA